MNGTAKQAFDLGQISPIKYFFTVAFVLGVLFALIIEGGDPSRPFFYTFLQWQLQTGLPIAILIIAHMILSRFSSFDRLNPWLQLLLSGLLGVVVFSPVALWLDYLFGQETFLSEKWLSQLLDEMAGMGPPVIISWLAMNAPWILGYRINQHDGIHAIESIEATEQPVDDVYTEPEFFKMLPAVIGNDVIFLKAELHYIEVNTVAGQALILYNLRDAIDELSYVSGIHCHRSYWVNLEHIKNFKKQGRQGQLMLSQGHKIPVSRTRISAVKNAVESAGTVQSTCV